MNESEEYIKNLHHEFSKAVLDETMVFTNPIEQFNKWLSDAIMAKVNEANAMVLSTVSATCTPSSRVLFLRDVNENGLVFYTNYNSRKGEDIAHNPNACANFFWPELERQIRVEGILQKLDDALSDHYFNGRPRGSRIGAWASAQSSVLTNRKALEARYAELEQQFAGREIPRPPHWGGYCLVAGSFEFWQGRPSRLHDRLRYTKSASSWKIERLSP